GRRVEVEVVLLHVLAVISLGVGKAEEPLLDDGVAAVPEGEREAEPLVVVGDAREAVLAPVVGARARLVVAEVAPGVAVVAVVLAHRPPLPLAQVGAPLAPGDVLLARFGEARALGSVAVVGHGVPPFLAAAHRRRLGRSGRTRVPRGCTADRPRRSIREL